MKKIDLNKILIVAICMSVSTIGCSISRKNMYSSRTSNISNSNPNIIRMNDNNLIEQEEKSDTREVKNSEEFDPDKFLKLMNKSLKNIEAAKGLSIIPFLGVTGDGKSTTVNCFIKM